MGNHDQNGAKANRVWKLFRWQMGLIHFHAHNHQFGCKFDRMCRNIAYNLNSLLFNFKLFLNYFYASPNLNTSDRIYHGDIYCVGCTLVIIIISISLIMANSTVIIIIIICFLFLAR